MIEDKKTRCFMRLLKTLLDDDKNYLLPIKEHKNICSNKNLFPDKHGKRAMRCEKFLVVSKVRLYIGIARGLAAKIFVGNFAAGVDICGIFVYNII